MAAGLDVSRSVRPRSSAAPPVRVTVPATLVVRSGEVTWSMPVFRSVTAAWLNDGTATVTAEPLVAPMNTRPLPPLIAPGETIPPEMSRNPLLIVTGADNDPPLPLTNQVGATD